MTTKPRRYNGDMTIYSEDGCVSVGKSLETGEWFMEGIVNEEGSYVSVTISEAQLRSLVDYIDRHKGAA